MDSATSWPIVRSAGGNATGRSSAIARTVAQLGDRFAAEMKDAVAGLRDGFPRPVRLAVAGLEQVDHLVAPGMQELGDQAAVAPPPERLRTHEAGLGLCERRSESALPRCRAHSRGIAAEGGDPDAAEALLPGLPAQPPTEVDRVAVRHIRL